MKTVLFLGTHGDEPYLRFLRDALPKNVTCKVTLRPVTTVAEILRLADAFITTSPQLLEKLAQKKGAKIDDYAGSLFVRDGKEFVVINPLQHFVTVNYGEFLAKRWLSKLFDKESWFPQPEFKWELASDANIEQLYERFKKDAWLIAVDIETSRKNLAIDVAGYCAIFPDFTTLSVVIPIHNNLNLFHWAKKFNELPQPKIFQNGMYDNSYFLRWGIPPVGWYFDTLHMFHAWYSELPKSLDFISAFMLREIVFWKDESESDYYTYNAKDTWSTACSFLALMHEMPAWAIENYKIEFPLVYPCLHCSMEGFAIDKAERDRIAAEQEKKNAEALKELRIMTGKEEFNPASPKQMLSLLRILGAKDATSSDRKTMDKVRTKHPLNEMLLSRVINYRESAKLLSSYLDKELLEGRFLYSLNPAGTDTGRMASKSSSFWCGSQIQNIPPGVKSMFVADDGWLLAEIDKEQAEDRCVAFLSGDAALLEIFSSGKDSHSVKGEMFFGVPADEIRRLDKAKKPGEFSLRDLTKRVNHGANYNMGAGVLLETMGLEKVAQAKRLLRLPAELSPIQVCQHLLKTYEKAFPSVKGRWYNAIRKEVSLTGRLKGATGWTRYCFGRPENGKHNMNALVAHVPQSLSVMIVNKEFLEIWRFALQNPTLIRLKAQIHDSIVFQYKATNPEIPEKILAMMKTTVKVKGSDGVIRDMLIPSSVNAGKTRWTK